MYVLNLIINGLPSKLCQRMGTSERITIVLNLIINGLPSKLKIAVSILLLSSSFKPYYKWITF